MTGPPIPPTLLPPTVKRSGAASRPFVPPRPRDASSFVSCCSVSDNGLASGVDCQKIKPVIEGGKQVSWKGGADGQVKIVSFLCFRIPCSWNVHQYSQVILSGIFHFGKRYVATNNFPNSAHWSNSTRVPSAFSLMRVMWQVYVESSGQTWLEVFTLRNAPVCVQMTTRTLSASSATAPETWAGLVQIHLKFIYCVTCATEWDKGHWSQEIRRKGPTSSCIQCGASWHAGWQLEVFLFVGGRHTESPVQAERPDATYAMESLQTVS